MAAAFVLLPGCNGENGEIDTEGAAPVAESETTGEFELAVVGFDTMTCGPGTGNQDTVTVEPGAAATLEVGKESGNGQFLHTVSFPAGAVASSTLFRLIDRAEYLPLISLDALDQNGNPLPNFQFETPISISISYQNCQPPSNPDTLQIYVPAGPEAAADGPAPTLPNKRVDATRKMVTAETDHLTEYVLGTPD